MRFHTLCLTLATMGSIGFASVVLADPLHKDITAIELAAKLLGQINFLTGLVSLVVILFAGNMFWIRRHVKKNDDKWTLNFRQHRDYDKLKGEHSASMDLRGCAFEPKRLKVLIDNAIREAMRDPTTRDRVSDHIPPPYTEHGGPHGATD